MARRNKLLIICGPTATGKTALGLLLAKKFKGEIISADSRQVYRGMDIATGKDIEEGKWVRDHWEIQGVPLWLLDVVEPHQEFSVAQYIDLAQKKIRDIWQRRKSRLEVEDPRRRASGLPILVGGTGFYIKGLIDGIGTLGVEADWELRMRLENLSAEKLFDLLSRLNPVKAASLNASDRKNPRRLIRAIEIATRQKPETKNLKPKTSVDTLFIGLKAELKKLYKRIDKRVEERVKGGVEKEIKGLIRKGYSWDMPAMSALGYREWQDFFEGRLGKEEVIQKWKFDEHGYARRQMTWFRKDPRIHWFDITEDDWTERVEGLVKSWYNGKIKVRD
jgi:tRNA dimethylallyltransferase